jgi:hypothetical protein
MATIYNPLTYSSVEETGSIGSIIKNIRDWVNVASIQLSAKRMLEEYRSKPFKDWQTDFLRIVQHYSLQHIQQATSIANIIMEEDLYRTGSYFAYYSEQKCKHYRLLDLNYYQEYDRLWYEYKQNQDHLQCEYNQKLDRLYEYNQKLDRLYEYKQKLDRFYEYKQKRFRLHYERLYSEYKQNRVRFHREVLKELDRLESEELQELDRLESEHNQELDRLDSEHNQELDRLQSEHKQYLDRLHSEHKQYLDRLQSERDQELQRRLSDIQDLNELDERFSYKRFLENCQKYQKQKTQTFLKSCVIDQKECECAICLNFDASQNKVIELKCKHKFHSECISQWLSNTNNCPMCRCMCI